MTAWIEARKDLIEVFGLPEYSPEPNPLEYLNNDPKGEADRTGLPDGGGAVHAIILTLMNNLARVPTHVVSYFLRPKVQYIAAIELWSYFMPY